MDIINIDTANRSTRLHLTPPPQSFALSLAPRPRSVIGLKAEASLRLVPNRTPPLDVCFCYNRAR